MIDKHENDEAETPDVHDDPVQYGAAVADESQEPQEPQSVDAGLCLQVVVVSVQQALYGIRIDTVREILRVSKITWIPWTPRYIVGIMNVRGEMLPVVDARLFLQHGVGQVTDSSRIVVIESGNLVAGLLVDAMVDILDVPIATFQTIVDETDHDAPKYCAGQLRWQETALTLLDSALVLQVIVVDQG